MLKKWIEEIREQPDLYKADCWKYHISGNVIEISILPDFIKQKDLYRCSVIAVGQVLKVLSIKIEGNNSAFHIQSFPNIDNPEIVATIRMHNNGEFPATSAKRNQNNSSKTVTEVIKKLANENQLEVEQIASISALDLNDSEIPTNDYNTWFKLYSAFNNPFTWLNIGYMKESVRHEFATEKSLSDVCLIDYISLKNNQEADHSSSDNRYLQYLIGIQQQS